MSVERIFYVSWGGKEEGRVRGIELGRERECIRWKKNERKEGRGEVIEEGREGSTAGDW